MEQWSYPIGRFEFEVPVRDEDRRDRIGAADTAPAALRMALEGLTDEQLDTPYREGGWTARQVAHHVADAAMNMFIRLKLALTEDNPTVKPFEENDWVRLPDSERLPPEVSVRLFEALQTRMNELLRSLPGAAFDRTFRNPASGEWTIDKLIAYYAWHGHHHTAQIDTLRRRMGW